MTFIWRETALNVTSKQETRSSASFSYSPPTTLQFTKSIQIKMTAKIDNDPMISFSTVQLIVFSGSTHVTVMIAAQHLMMRSHQTDMQSFTVFG